MTQQTGPIRRRPQGSHSNIGLKERVSPPDPPGHIPSPPQSPAEVGGSGARGGGRRGLFRTHTGATPLCPPHAACIRCRPRAHRFTAFALPTPFSRETEVGRPFLPRGNTNVFKDENGTSGIEVGEEFPPKRLAKKSSPDRNLRAQKAQTIL